MTIHITEEIKAAYEAYLDEAVDCDFSGHPIRRRDAFPFVGGHAAGLVDFAAGFQAARTSGVKGLVMADGSSLLDYLNVGDDPPNTDEWTKGFHEARRRLHRILAPQLTSGVIGTLKENGNG